MAWKFLRCELHRIRTPRKKRHIIKIEVFDSAPYYTLWGNKKKLTVAIALAMKNNPDFLEIIEGAQYECFKDGIDEVIAQYAIDDLKKEMNL
jgi:hypothetical protein